MKRRGAAAGGGGQSLDRHLGHRNKVMLPHRGLRALQRELARPGMGGRALHQASTPSSPNGRHKPMHRVKHDCISPGGMGMQRTRAFSLS